MRKLVFASTRRGAGKTSTIVGMAEAARPNFGYMKPFGDRLLYRKKRLWDYDAALVTDLFSLKENAEDISISHQHSKVRYMYDADMTKGKLLFVLKDEVVVKGTDALAINAVALRIESLSFMPGMGIAMAIPAAGPCGCTPYPCHHHRATPRACPRG